MKHPEAVRFLSRAGFFVEHHSRDRFDRRLADAISEFVHGQHPPGEVGVAEFGDESLQIGWQSKVFLFGGTRDTIPCPICGAWIFGIRVTRPPV